MRQGGYTPFSAKFLQSFGATFTASHFVSPFSGPSCFAQTPGLLSLHDSQENMSSVRMGREKRPKYQKRMKALTE